MVSLPKISMLSKSMLSRYHWLLAVYNGDKSPSRNEFDEDYSDYLHKQKAGHSVSSCMTAALVPSLLSSCTELS